MAVAVGSSRAGDEIKLPIGVVLLAARRRQSRHERMAEVALSSITVLMTGFLFACLRHAVRLAPIQFVP